MPGPIINALENVADKDTFVFSGSKINLYNSILRALWRGDNVGRSRNILKKAHDVSGYTLNCDPGGDPGVAHPYKGSDASVMSTPNVAITPGSHNGVIPTISGSSMIPPVTVPPTPAPLLTLDAGAKIVYAELDWTTGEVTSVEINSSDSFSPPANSIDPSTSTGSSYQILFFVQVVIDPDTGNASVSCTDNVSGSQYAAICLSSVSYQLV